MSAGLISLQRLVNGNGFILHHRFKSNWIRVQEQQQQQKPVKLITVIDLMRMKISDSLEIIADKHPDKFCSQFQILRFKMEKESLLRYSDSYFSCLWWLFVQSSLFWHEQMQYKKQVISSSIAEICTKTFWMQTLFNEMANTWICLKKLNQKSRNLMPWRDDIMLSEINTLVK